MRIYVEGMFIRILEAVIELQIKALQDIRSYIMLLYLEHVHVIVYKYKLDMTTILSPMNTISYEIYHSVSTVTSLYMLLLCRASTPVFELVRQKYQTKWLVRTPLCMCMYVCTYVGAWCIHYMLMSSASQGLCAV